MQTITTIGLDIAKSVFQVHGVDAAGQVVIRRKLKRRYVLAFFQKLPPCLVGIEACASSHYWARELQMLGNAVGLASSLRDYQLAVFSCGGPKPAAFRPPDRLANGLRVGNVVLPSTSTADP